MLIKINTIKTSESPEPRCQLSAVENSCSIMLPINIIFLAPRRSEMANVVSDGTNTIVTPLIIPGRLSGNVTLKNTCALFAPRSLAAFNTFSSIFC